MPGKSAIRRFRRRGGRIDGGKMCVRIDELRNLEDARAC